MRILGLKSVIRRKRPDYVKSTPEITAENVLNRDFKATVPFEKWLTDVTEFKYYVGPEVKKLYLSAILDLYDRLTNESEGRRTFTWNFGMKGGL